MLDHLVYATPALLDTVAALEQALGVRPVEGGRHLGLGTRNYLLGLGGRRYLEIVGPDPEQPEPDGPRWFSVDELDGPRLVNWCVRPADLDGTLAEARRHGLDLGEPRPMSRRTVDGELLEWRLTMPGRDPLTPFLIDWGATVHPAERGLPEVPLLSLTGRHPDPERARARLRALGMKPDAERGAELGVERGVELEVERRDVPALVARLAGGVVLT
ncbi:VOC family protein [Nonomuraea sp. FMUSA5-5]|uniref:VOC family protein n=1 Tax=Nonomuraea composti TaxID=2720023 RepID=A0ABX1BD12_9ACTN|nr:VOC family protein [Nonomuraea sp. FMUSA5-5]NJP95679.1 VOC family protein [Nonomuraea sp. FMUSA5-5]